MKILQIYDYLKRITLSCYYRLALTFKISLVKRIIKRNATPITEYSEKDFNYLQKYYAPPPEYGYDSFSTWRRGVERANKLLEFSDLKNSVSTVLEVCCGDGMVGYAMQCYGHNVTLTDLTDWRDSRSKGVNFMKANTCVALPFKSEKFDLVYSFNAFEHLDDPEIALREFIRVCKTGGLIYISFGPLYASEYGLHVFRTIYAPYSQYLFSDNFLMSTIDKVGINDLGGKSDKLQHTNKWKLNQYNELWKASCCNVLIYNTYKSYKNINVIIKYPFAFQGRNLSIDDIATQEVTILLEKNDKLKRGNT